MNIRPEVRLNVVLHKAQRIVHASNARIKYIKAGKRFGKSHLSCFELVQKALDVEHGTFWYIAPTYKQAKEIAWRKLLWMIPPELIVGKPNKEELLIKFTSQSVLQLKGADNEDSLRGPELDGTVWDEYAYINPYAYEGIVRSQLIDKKGFAHFISSPFKRGRNHFTIEHADALREMKAGNEKYGAWHFSIYDNPTLDRAEIEDVRAKTRSDIWEIEYMANESAGSVNKFPMFDQGKNVGKCLGTEGKFMVRGLDWGISKGHPTAFVVIFVDLYRKQIYVTDAKKFVGMIAEDIMKRVAAITPKNVSNPDPIVIDPSAARTAPETGVRLIDHFNSIGHQLGQHCILGDRNERGYDIVNMYMQHGWLKIDPALKDLIIECEEIKWDDREGDDLTDALRYACVRIHDTCRGMNILDEGVYDEALSDDALFEREKKGFYNMNNIFKKKPDGYTAWVREEMRKIA